MERPFTKSTNERGNDVYKGVGRNATNPGSSSVTAVVEFTKSKAEAKTVYDYAVDTKGKEGYVFSSEATAYRKSICTQCTAVWTGYNGNKFFACDYEYDPQFSTWMVTTQTFTTT